MDEGEAVRITEAGGGMGAFAARDLHEGSFVTTLTGPICSLADVARKNLCHLHWLGGEDWVVLSSPARYVNHSCAPNARVAGGGANERRIVTTRALRVGEEITIAYDLIAEGEFGSDDPMLRFWHPDWTFDCRCGAPRCRGRIDGRVIERVEPTGRRSLEKISRSPMTIGHDPAIEVREVAGKGKGVFALRDFRPGEIIERAPVIVVPKEQCREEMDTALDDYYFAWGPELQDSAVALGYGSLYNHSYRPNSRFVRMMDARALHIVVCRKIRAGEEITFLYNHFEEPLWFDVIE